MASAVHGSAGASERIGAHGAGVRFDRIVKRYPGAASNAVDGVSLDIEPGEFVTMLGPSGSGKTTTLMMLAGFETPSSGEIYVDGEPIAAVPPFRRNIGMVFQSYALFPHMTVGENIAFPLKMRKLDKAEIGRRSAEVLELVGLPGYERRYPRQLSGGQQQRIAVARALVFNPRVLLMDEPLGALDKQLRERLQYEIKALHEQLGVTIVYVTHDQQEALVMSDRVAVMNDGRIAQIGTPDELYDEPANRFVASFIGESNFLDGRLAGVEGPFRLVEVPGVGMLRAAAPHEVSAADVVLTVRPEKLVFGEADGREPSNTVSATVEQVIFVGETHRYHLGLPGGATLVLKQPHRAGMAVPRQGDAVRVSWHAADGRVVEGG